MLRTLILVVIVACGGSSQPATTDDAGKVIELTGKVTATRNNATRTLAVGHVVASDDLIVTAAESSAVIELAHNRARWSLEAGITSRVDASIAWSLPMQDQAKAVDHATSAAGRNAEREAAETQATAKRVLETAQVDSEREAAKAKLESLKRDKAEMEKRLADAKAAAATSERRKGIKISQECMNNPLARGCDGPEIDVKAKVAIKRMDDFATELCACVDIACARKVDAAYAPWRAQLDKTHPATSQIGRDITSGSKTSLERYNQCRARHGL